MKRLMAAALAATLMCGASAYAQDAQPAASADASNVVSNAPAGQPPAQYPPCTHRGEDRCVARAGLSEGHAKTHHHHKAKAKASEPASDSSAGA